MVVGEYWKDADEMDGLRLGREEVKCMYVCGLLKEGFDGGCVDGEKWLVLV